MALLAGCAALALAASCSRSGSSSSEAAINAVLTDPARSAADRERDARDHPREVLALARFGSGMTVADVFGGGGYYSEILAAVVGKSGHVRLINNKTYDHEMGAEAAGRLAGNRLPNVSYEVASPDDLKLGSASLDGAMIVMSYHDLYFADAWRGWAPIDAGRFIDQIAAALKPGGVLLIVDHAARPGSGRADAQTLHRIDEDFAVADFKAHGLELAGSIDTLRNRADDHALTVFDPHIRHRTDRFVKIFRKPG